MMPVIPDHPYRGQWVAIATMHSKERAIAPALCSWFDMTVTTAPGVDTDVLGTFTGEIARQGTMLDAARQKAKLAIAQTGAPFGIGSEGAFGPDPYLTFASSGLELILLIEAATGREVFVSRRAPTNFDHIVTKPGKDITAFLKQIGFPDHAVVVRPEGDGSADSIVKGVRDTATLNRALAKCADRSPSSRVVVSTDMRAHLNPTRMAAIARTAKWLALKIARQCPACSCPGFGRVDVERGVLCRDCDSPTRLIRAEVYGCEACGHRMRRHERSERLRSDPMWCDFCNP